MVRYAAGHLGRSYLKPSVRPPRTHADRVAHIGGDASEKRPRVRQAGVVGIPEMLQDCGPGTIGSWGGQFPTAYQLDVFADGLDELLDRFVA